jgi:hypothetical protein
MGRGEESEGGQRFLAGILDVVAQRRQQHEHAARSDRDYGAVLDKELAAAGNDVLRLFGRFGVPAKPLTRFDLVDDD